MARSGLYKTDVKKARDFLLVQGKHPSVDSVRIALGNTGSKSTIHKYLKELEEEEGGFPDRRSSISESLQDLVARLASQLQEESEADITSLQASHAEERRQFADTIASLEKELTTLRSAFEQLETQRLGDQAALTALRDSLQQETLARHTAQQQASDLKERLLENEAHRRSLEEKHQHAREALEHYRNSVKEQRDQDSRRHELQVQQLQTEMRQLQQSLIVKQEDVTRLNQEGVRLVGDLSHAQQRLMEKDSQIHDLERHIAPLITVTAQLKSKEVQVEELNTLLSAARQKNDEFEQRIRDLELKLAVSNTKLETQHALMNEWRTEKKGHPS
jgi:chromosome segregation ATPase